MAIIAELAVRFTAELGNLNKGFDDAISNVNRAGHSIKDAGKSLSLGITTPILAAGTAVFKFGSAFESEMSKITGLVTQNAAQTAEWADELVALAPKVAKTPKELAEGLFFVTSAGFRGAEAIEVLTIAARASSAGLGDTALIADALTSAINAYGSANLSSSQAADILTAAVREGKLEAASLAPVLGQVLPTASALGVSFADVSATLAVFSRTGVDAARGATSLNAFFSALLKTTGESEKALEDVGLSLSGLRAEMAGPEGVIGAMRTLDKAFAGNTDQMAVVIPNVEAFRGVLNVLAQETETVDSVLRGVTNATGSLDTAFQAASSTSQFKLDAALAGVQGSLIGLADVGLPLMISGLEKLTGFIERATDWWNGLSEEQQRFIFKAAAVAAAIGPILVGLGTMITAVTRVAAGVKLFIAGFKVASIVLSGVGAPIGLVIAALVAVGFAVKAVIDNWSVISYETGRMVDAIKDQLARLAPIFAVVSDNVEKVVGFFKGMYKAVVGGSIVPDMISGIDTEFKQLDVVMAGAAERAAARTNAAFQNIINPSALRAMDFNVTLDADDLYSAVIGAGDQAALTFFNLSTQTELTRATLESFSTASDINVDMAIKLANEQRRLTSATEQLEERQLILSQTLGLADIAVRDLTTRNKDQIDTISKIVIPELNALSLASADTSAANLALSETINKPVSEAMARFMDAVDESAHQVAIYAQDVGASFTNMGLVGKQALNQVAFAGLDLISSFSPLALLSDILSAAFDALEPFITVLKAPLKILGTLLAASIIPILKLLFPVMKFLAIAATYVQEVFNRISQGILFAVGHMVRGLGKAIDALPFVSGKGIIRAGEALLDASKGFGDAARAAQEAREEIKALTWPEGEEGLAAATEATNATTEAVNATTVATEAAVVAIREEAGILTKMAVILESIDENTYGAWRGIVDLRGTITSTGVGTVVPPGPTLTSGPTGTLSTGRKVAREYRLQGDLVPR